MKRKIQVVDRCEIKFTCDAEKGWVSGTEHSVIYGVIHLCPKAKHLYLMHEISTCVSYFLGCFLQPKG